MPLVKKVPAITPELNRIITKMLAPDINRRYKNVGKIIEDLDQMGQKKKDNSHELENIKRRLEARKQRTDYVCWSCRKTMPRKMKTCLYCGADQ